LPLSAVVLVGFQLCVCGMVLYVWYEMI